MSATTIIDTAPLGALIRYTDGSPKPPTRFTKKLAAWERSNGVGRLVKKEPPRVYLLQIVTRDIDAYQRLIDALLDARIGLARYFTYIVTKPVKSSGTIPFEALLGDG